MAGKKDQVNIFSLDNEFEKKMADGGTKAKVSMEMDYAGKKVKHESSTEFDGLGCHGAGRHGFMKHMFLRHGHGHIGDCGDIRRFGIKAKLARLTFFLDVLNSLKVEEKEDQSTVLSLSFDEISGEMKKMIHEKMLHKQMLHEYGQDCVCKEFSGMEALTGGCNVFINKNKEVEKIILTLEGRSKDDLNEPHQMEVWPCGRLPGALTFPTARSRTT
ncbi:hypothetical protein Psch_02109 [Pelotomaculum schinkii]|uniref:Uncharacterized protein n=1 Tax=Pelotomaculum schinkii TaxID=78350 RepID=A0A4Y7RHR7_9FIRM|nr:hypothetical protein [Pelotomaculum schinkii]TEB08545.1 hypothetical protein Psch_02109 [Pelotomaculum schinkii]